MSTVEGAAGAAGDSRKRLDDIVGGGSVGGAFPSFFELELAAVCSELIAPVNDRPGVELGRTQPLRRGVRVPSEFANITRRLANKVQKLL
eukprot:CAMPEP_0174855058 /NCGR_PEP_ID=MMETSP1114-20130205/32382_1 /TAXON_ID=312471 /ORGANISM="Neobodo designis, Strain CCAP 1951/1" /LENGTH=89 /DNA_ID=CAMNT_0016089779 /DNA_START=216 /DNA_END=482 /DNA_ORIENTATION=+